jgi:hypothetical protein
VTRRRARPLLVIALGVSILLGSCGLPADSAPRVIAADKVPFNLLGPSTTAPGNEVGGDQVKLYFVDGDRLRAVDRLVVANATPQLVLDALLRGPATDDSSTSSSGATSSDSSGSATLTGAIPPETRVLRADLQDGTLTVVLTKEILSVTGPLQKIAFAQMVYTATALHGVSQVRFRVADADGSNEQDVEPPTDTGANQGTLTRSDYEQLAPAPSS